MPDLESLIFSMALILFLLIGSAKLIIEELIALVMMFKKLKATIDSDYSLLTGKLEVPSEVHGQTQRTISIDDKTG